jgi:hypothetical protein
MGADEPSPSTEKSKNPAKINESGGICKYWELREKIFSDPRLVWKC